MPTSGSLTGPPHATSASTKRTDPRAMRGSYRFSGRANEPSDDALHRIAQRLGRGQTAERLPKDAAVLVAHSVELDPEASPAIAGAPSMNHARDVPERVDE